MSVNETLTLVIARLGATIALGGLAKVLVEYEDAADAKEKLTAVIDSAPEGTPQKARTMHPEAWGST